MNAAPAPAEALVLCRVADLCAIQDGSDEPLATRWGRSPLTAQVYASYAEAKKDRILLGTEGSQALIVTLASWQAAIAKRLLQPATETNNNTPGASS